MRQNWAVLVGVGVAIVLLASVAVAYTIRKRYAYDVAATQRRSWYESLDSPIKPLYNLKVSSLL